MAAIHNFRIWSHDVSQAYLQSSEQLMRKVYLKPPKELNLSSDELLELLKPLYGLPDAGDYWDRTMSHHLRNELLLIPTYGDFALYFRSDENGLHGLIGVYVDDSLICGNDKFMKLTDQTLERFESRDREFDHTTFAGVKVTTHGQDIHLDQNQYLSKLSPLSPDASFSDYRSLRAKLAWAVHTRPDIACAVAFSAQVTEDTFSPDSIKRINKVVSHIRKTPSLSLKYQPLDLQSLRIQVYSDAAFANTDDLKSQLGYIVLLTEKTNRCHIHHYSSKKSQRVVRSVLAAEVYAFAEAFDHAYTLRTDLERILKRTIPLTMLTDSKSLFDIITKCTHTAEKRLMIDITSVRDAYNAEEISNVGFVRTKQNPADAFTKVDRCKALQSILASNACHLPVEQWVIRLQQDNQ